MKKIGLGLLLIVLALKLQAAYILLPMDAESQKDHLKAYGITYWVLEKGSEAWWLLNYRGGSFAFPHNREFEKECLTRGVSYEIIPDAQFNKIINDISDPEVNMDAMKLEKAPKIAVYTPEVNAKGEKVQPWDDAVTLVLTYAEIPYTTIYDKEVINNELVKYDWLHLHHEDFTGQYGRFYRSFNNQPWYRENQRRMEELAHELGFSKVSQLKLAVVKKIKEYVVGGGFMFAMCSATDTYDIALAAEGIDICAEMYDGDPMDPNAQSKLDFSKTFAFENFQLSRNPLEYEYSSIDHSRGRNINPEQDYFTLFDFSAKWDPVPTMLTQNHTRTVKGFMGQTTAFSKEFIKSNVLIMGENKPAREARYIHGNYGQGFWTFYGGHDPEDYRHYVHDPETDLSLHPNSPGYRLILDNVLFPAAKKKNRKT
ncbi:MAG: asparagine synthetase B [Phaeodactylibacter sp.]|nr:asparagine synthetase B [Phaeodactylibacter sp.]MCB9299073.1 asparagine synthetase B [Lewinellaceae bacterium]HQU60333.1 asparagine synthetase B [Saprospiraceae bacterium]